jgi:hypothetical protein
LAEHRALEGELQALENGWREAEEIDWNRRFACVPARVEELLARHRREFPRRAV